FPSFSGRYETAHQRDESLTRYRRLKPLTGVFHREEGWDTGQRGHADDLAVGVRRLDEHTRRREDCYPAEHLCVDPLPPSRHGEDAVMEGLDADVAHAVEQGQVVSALLAAPGLIGARIL